MVDVYSYFDYRKLLKALYDDRKKTNKYFSYRYLGNKAEFKSAGYFSNVLKGKCNISLTVAFKIAEVFKLKKHEIDFFKLLVQYETTTSQNEKADYFEKIISQRKSKLKSIKTEQHEFFNRWYYVAIREIINLFPFKGDDYKPLAKMCYPPITTKEAEKAINVLEEMGMIQKNSTGYYEQVDSVLTTGDEWSSLAIRHFQGRTLDLAKHALSNCPRKYRDFSTLTLSIGGEHLAQIKHKIDQVQREILEIAKNAQNSDKVYQLNFQMFPMSQVEK